MRFHQGFQAIAHSLRSCNGERPDSPANELAIEDKGRDAAKVIRMQVRQDDGFNRVRIDTELAYRDHCRGAAIDEETRLAAIDQEAGVEASAGAERIARAEKLQSHRGTPIEGGEKTLRIMVHFEWAAKANFCPLPAHRKGAGNISIFRSVGLLLRTADRRSFKGSTGRISLGPHVRLTPTAHQRHLEQAA